METKLIHIGYTNEYQIRYLTEDKEEGSVYPDTEDQCYIPVYILEQHAHRAGGESKVFCENLSLKRNLEKAKLELDNRPKVKILPKPEGARSWQNSERCENSSNSTGTHYFPSEKRRCARFAVFEVDGVKLCKQHAGDACLKKSIKLEQP